MSKIINDPVYGFIRIKNPLVQKIIDHPYFQRLRRIKQMGSAELVYPGANHTRFHHSLGAYHLMGVALHELQLKGIKTSKEERLHSSLAILLHDIGHGPFSHALEKIIIPGLHHESLSKQLIQVLNEEFNGKLEQTLAIFNNNYTDKPWLHALISSQYDMDRMDYLNRDSYYTGVSEGVIGYDRILHMLTVQNDTLVVEEKGLHSIEKFLIARRIMYWQVYQHKAVLAAELIINQILKRAKELFLQNKDIYVLSPLKYFFALENQNKNFNNLDYKSLELFCELDDYDIVQHIKIWSKNDDYVLSQLCKGYLERKIYKIISFNEEAHKEWQEKMENMHAKHLNNQEELNYFVFNGKASNRFYDIQSDAILFQSKSGNLKSLHEYEHSLIHAEIPLVLEKNYLAYFPHEEKR